MRGTSAISPAKSVYVSWSSLSETQNTWNGYLPYAVSLTDEKIEFKSHNNTNLSHRNSTKRDVNIHSMCVIPLNPLVPCFVPSQKPYSDCKQFRLENQLNYLDTKISISKSSYQTQVIQTNKIRLSNYIRVDEIFARKHAYVLRHPGTQRRQHLIPFLLGTTEVGHLRGKLD